jgi:hypothetical protein
MSELRFSSEEAALQYLADISGKSVRVAGDIKGPGIPDGTGPGKDSEDCLMKKPKKVRGVPDGTGPGRNSEDCPNNK